MKAQATTHSPDEATEPVITETEIETAARIYFERWPHAEQIVVIKKTANKIAADVSVIDRAAGPRVTVRLPADDYLEGGCQGLAARFSNARTELVYC